MRIRLLTAAVLTLVVDFGLSRTITIPFFVALAILFLCWGLLIAGRAWPVVLLMIAMLVPWRSEPVPKVIIDKAQQTLTVQGGKEPRVFHVAFGPSPKGNKDREGDGRTPEGLYRIIDRSEDTPYHRWLGLSYPNRADMWRARREGRWSWLDFAFQANSQTSQLGGYVGVHGGGSKRNWTLGCIALDNRDAEEVYQAVQTGDGVLIRSQ